MTFHFADKFYSVKLTQHITQYLGDDQHNFKIQPPQSITRIGSHIKCFAKSKNAGVCCKTNNGGKDRFLFYAAKREINWSR